MATLRWGTVIAVALSLAGIALAVYAFSSPADASEATVLATSRSEETPIKLGAEARHIRLIGDTVETVLGRSERARLGERIYLVLDEVRAGRQPGILYEILLGIDNGIPSSAQPIGYLNFFEPQRRLVSFEVTDQLQTLFAGAPGGRALAVTIRPAPAVGPSQSPELRRLLDEANLTVARVRLVAQ